MNKVNLCWVLADGRKGHDIQSLTLAQAISHEVRLFPFSLRQPWLALAPRLTTGIKHGIHWHQATPHEQPDQPRLIITAGRRAAVAGRHIKQTLTNTGHPCQHLQILNPHGNLKHYDLLLIPEHDQLKGNKVITYRGSLHPYTRQWHHQQPTSAAHQPHLALMLGNPGRHYWNHSFPQELQAIRAAFPDTPLYLCGSPRLDQSLQKQLRDLLTSDDRVWFGQSDGDNPYLKLLCNAKKLFVTADSINMINECLAAPRPTTLLATLHPKSDRHRRFIESVSTHCVPIEAVQGPPAPVDAIEQVVSHPSFREWLMHST